MGAQRPAHPQAPPAERGEPSGAEWTQQHYQCAASSGQMTGTRRAATDTRRAATGPRRKHIARARRPTRDGNARRCARNTWPRARHKPVRNTTPQVPRAEHNATGTQADTGRARRRRPKGNTMPRAPRPTRAEHAAGAPRGTQCHGHPGRHGPSTPQAPRGEHIATAPGPTRDEHATGTPQVHVRRAPDRWRTSDRTARAAWPGADNLARVTQALGRVLVVDDDEVIRQLIAVNLQLEGFDVSIAVDGQDCLDKVGTIAPNVITLDVMMPRLDGWETAV